MTTYRTREEQDLLDVMDARDARDALDENPPRVVRLRRKGGEVVQDCTLYIGRECRQGGWSLEASPWANPFKVGRDGSIDEVLAKYEAHVRGQRSLMERIPELAGQTLGCWCSPKPCHGDVLVKLFLEQRGV